MFEILQTLVKRTARNGKDANPPIMRHRKYRMERPVSLGRHWVNGDPFATAFFNSLSISFPHAEIFMIDSIKPWREHISKPLAEEVKVFIQQELNHSQEHVAFNSGMQRSGYEIKHIEKDIRNLVTQLNLKDDLYRLRATLCMEHLTAIIAHEFLTHESYLDGADEDLKQMWLWHATEEIEHKAVAFNMWNEVTKDWSNIRRYLSRVSFFLGISYTFFRNRTIAQINLLGQDGYNRHDAFVGMMRYGFAKNGLARRVLKSWAHFLKPNFHPWDLDDRHLIAAGESKFTFDKNPHLEPMNNYPKTKIASQSKAA